MATSGTVATTTIDTAALLEHGIRRCKLIPSAQTPESIQVATNCLKMLCLNLSNRGLNLWAVEKAFMGLSTGKPTYTTPDGTIDVLNVVYTQPTLVTVAFSAITAGGKATLTTSTTIQRIGFKLSAAFTGQLLLSSSPDDATYTVQSTLAPYTYVAGQYYWADLPTATAGLYFKVTSAAAPYPVVSDIQLASALYDLPVTIWNRDTYAAQNNKNQQGRPSTNYFFEKKLTPQITLWPVPNNSTDHLTIFRHRQVQDVGTLIQQLEIPERWLDGIIWLLAARLCFELPGVEDARIQLVMQMAQQQVFEAEGAEGDGSPIFLAPNIAVYTR